MESGDLITSLKSDSSEVIVGLDEVRWYVTETLHMQALKESQQRYTVRMIGFVKNQTLMITAPMINGKYVAVKEGQAFIFRAFPGKRAYAFTASVVKLVFSPYPFLHLTYPKQISYTVIRHSSRVSTNINAMITLDATNESFPVSLIDLSIGGASALSKGEQSCANTNGTIRFTLPLADAPEEICISIAIRSIAPTAINPLIRYGLEFMNVSPQLRILLSAFIQQASEDDS